MRAAHADPDERLVLLSGRLVYEKGFQVALAALPAVIRRVGRVRFVVAGLARTRPSCARRPRALGLDAHGAFLGWVGDERLDALYRVADACVVPSLYEPFGLVALEAMAAGCPCVSPTPAVCARSCPTTSGCACARATRARWPPR